MGTPLAGTTNKESFKCFNNLRYMKRKLFFATFFNKTNCYINEPIVLNCIFNILSCFEPIELTNMQKKA